MKPATSTPIFVYGTLMNPQVVQVLLGRTLTLDSFPAARLSGYCRYPVKNYVFPGMVEHPDPDKFVMGCLLENLSPLDVKLFDWFEGNEYSRKLVKVSRIGGKDDDDTDVEAHAYIWKEELLNELERDGDEWDYETFCKQNLDWYLTNVVRPCRKETEDLGMTKL